MAYIFQYGESYRSMGVGDIFFQGWTDQLSKCQKPPTFDFWLGRDRGI